MKISEGKINYTEISNETKKLVEKISSIKSNSAEKVVASKKMDKAEKGESNQQSEGKSGSLKLAEALEEMTKDFDFNIWLELKPVERMKVAGFSQNLVNILSQFGITPDYMEGYNALGRDGDKLSALIEQWPVLKEYLIKNVDTLLDITKDYKDYIEAQNKETSQIMNPITDARYNSVTEDQSLVSYTASKDVFIASIREALNANDIKTAQEKTYLYFSKIYDLADRESLLRDKDSFNKLMERDVKQLVQQLAGRENELVEILITSQDKLDKAMEQSVYQVAKKYGEVEENEFNSLIEKHTRKNEVIKTMLYNDEMREVMVSAIAHNHIKPLTEHLQKYSKSNDTKHLDHFAQDFEKMTSTLSSALEGVKQEGYNKHLATAMKEMVTEIHNSLTNRESFKADFRRFKNNFCKEIDNKLLANESKGSSDKKFNLLDLVNDLVQSLLTKLHAKASLSEKYKAETFVERVTKHASDNSHTR
ncbi:hypothetical protein NF27_DP01870 [Candidatus Jidaibacter acanthamoeba]|uniref:Uncharacterized protein n=1 Tax=Candidatus Jidaibacter acanthamoebae TaxID=86105 RepID=A0A0C1QNL4_9RICK|nr:hypothetical protein [Candidatus Jidaibacter acanthamoeba]KIE05643.1 hypothetical protein NF27_DP01870 [Candidatus Jidaibacter acanthamoeba]